MGFVPPSWDVLATSLRPVHHEVEEFEPGNHRGWVDRLFKDGHLFHKLDDTAKALTRSGRFWNWSRVVKLSHMPSHTVGTPFVSCASSAPPSFAPLLDLA